MKDHFDPVNPLSREFIRRLARLVASHAKLTVILILLFLVIIWMILSGIWSAIWGKDHEIVQRFN